jgi:hypothetical protein
MLKPFLLCLSAIFVLPNFLDADFQAPAKYDGKEKFSPQLSFLNSVDKLEKFVDESANEKLVPVGSLAYMEILESTISHRFYTNYSHKNFSQDWISSLAGKIAGTQYSRLLLPGEIMLKPYAGPSQQAAVMMEILKRKNIPVRKSESRDHLAIEVSSKGEWFYFDPALDHPAKAAMGLHGNSYRQDGNPERYNDPGHGEHVQAPGKELTANLNSTYSTGNINLQQFQTATGILSKTLWLLPLAMMFLVKKRSFKMYAIKPIGKYVRMETMRPVFNG